MRHHHFADAGGWLRVTQRTPDFEEDVRPAVWGMFTATYAKIGLTLDHPGELDEYDIWDLYEDADGNFIAFRLSKTTPRGEKLGLVGSDGSRTGRAAVKDYVAGGFFQPEHYAEVSHRMQELAFEAGAPVVCAAYASEVLNKPIASEADGIHYRRNIKNVGEVTKVLVGRPYGVPTTPSEAPRCPIPSRVVAGRLGMPADRSAEAVFAHATSLVKL